MKNKIKLFTKIGILLFGISFFLIGCEKDDTETLHSNRENPNVSAFKITTITNQEVKQNDNLNIELEKIKQQVYSIKSNALNRTVYSTEYDFSIDTENVTYIENFDASYHSYTFPIFRTTPDELIENLLLSLQEDGSYKAFIVTYNLTEQEQESIANNQQIDLTDKASFTEINSDNLTSDILSRTVPCGYSSEWTCWEEACPIDGCWDPQYTITHCNSVLVYNDDCDLEIGGGSGSTDGSNSNGGGSTGNTNHDDVNNNDTTTNTNVTSPNIPTISDQIKNCINGLTLIGTTDNTTIDPDILVQLNLTKVEWAAINNNLQDSNCSEQAQQEAIEELLDLFIECVDNGNCSSSDCELIVDFEIGCSTLLIFEQDYKNRMSANEKQIFETMSRFNQLGYLANAQKATWKSEELFPNSLYNGKGDAFRHAYWNALNVILLGHNLAESLTTAHEDQPPSYSYSFKETQMDLFNNDVGRNRSSWFWDGYPSLEESILDAINTGQLRYLNNLAANGQATSNSQLIPTNQ